MTKKEPNFINYTEIDKCQFLTNDFYVTCGRCGERRLMKKGILIGVYELECEGCGNELRIEIREEMFLN